MRKYTEAKQWAAEVSMLPAALQVTLLQDKCVELRKQIAMHRPPRRRNTILRDVGYLQYIIQNLERGQLPSGGTVDENEEDVWSPIVATWLESAPPMFALADVLREAIEITPGNPDRLKIERRVGRVLRSLGCKPKVVWVEGKATRRWILKTLP